MYALDTIIRTTSERSLETLLLHHRRPASCIRYRAVGILLGADQVRLARQPPRIDLRRAAVCIGFSLSGAICVPELKE